MAGEHPTQVGALQLENLSKTFPGQKALRSVTLTVPQEQILGLVGQNGSGKSTLIKVISGYHHADAGSRARLGGRPVDLFALRKEERNRIRVVHQDLALLSTLTVAENLGLQAVLERRGVGHISSAKERAAARRALAQIDSTIDPDTLVGDLAPYERTVVAIARALDAADAVDLLILDEPTAALGRSDTDHLFRLLRRLRDRGMAILYVSHALEEIFEVCDAVAVLRDGQLVCQSATTAFDYESLTTAMLGNALQPTGAKEVSAVERAAPPLLDVDLFAHGMREEGVRFELSEGEVLGLTGLVGAGQVEVLESLFASHGQPQGNIRLRGEAYAPAGPADAIAFGVAYVPAERLHAGLMATESAAENIALPSLRALRRAGSRAEQAFAERLMRTTGVVPLDPSKRVELFSGGNQQKILLSKWLGTNPSILLINEPTQAVDVGAKQAIYEVIRDFASQPGHAVIVASGDVNEMKDACDRILVFRRGGIACEFVAGSYTEHELVLAAQR